NSSKLKNSIIDNYNLQNDCNNPPESKKFKIDTNKKCLDSDESLVKLDIKNNQKQVKNGGIKTMMNDLDNMLDDLTKVKSKNSTCKISDIFSFIDPNAANTYQVKTKRCEEELNKMESDIFAIGQNNKY
ncbi:hypothetical protein A3Q56_08395, partial [Intoshia linei]